MRLTYQSFIIFIIILSLFIAKDDFRYVYEKSFDYISHNISLFLDKTNDNNIFTDNNKTLYDIESNSNNIPKAIETPGALKVRDITQIPNNKNYSSEKLSINQIVLISNDYRKENGNLGNLKVNQKLNFSAQKKLEDMFMNQYFEHISPLGVGVSDLANEVSYEYITVGENLAMGNFDSDRDLVDAWMESPGHRANILNEHYTEIGVAVALGNYEGKKIWMAVQHFGLPKSFCPTIDEVLRGVISLEEKEIKKIEEDLAIRREMIDKRVVYEGLSTNEQISKYNGMIVIYNQLIFSLKEKIDTYNKQIMDFNSCLAENTATPDHE